MKKKNFVSMLLAAVGGILFGIGLCMCLLPQWNALTPGIVVGALGAAVLLALPPVRRKMAGKPPIRLNARAAGTLLLGTAGALALGVGLCMTMVWPGLLAPGIGVGVTGILLLLLLVPAAKGLAD